MLEEDYGNAKLIRFISIAVFFSMIPLILCSTIQFLYLSPETSLTMTNIFGEFQQLISTVEKYGIPVQWLVDISPVPSMKQLLRMENIKSFAIISAFVFSGVFWAVTQSKINQVNSFIRQAENSLNRQFNRMR
jgi:hypothetical protein